MENQALLDQRFDYIFFTGSVTVGKEVMAKAASAFHPCDPEIGRQKPLCCRKIRKAESDGEAYCIW